MKAGLLISTFLAANLAFADESHEMEIVEQPAAKSADCKAALVEAAPQSRLFVSPDLVDGILASIDWRPVPLRDFLPKLEEGIIHYLESSKELRAQMFLEIAVAILEWPKTNGELLQKAYGAEKNFLVLIPAMLQRIAQNIDLANNIDKIDPVIFKDLVQTLKKSFKGALTTAEQRELAMVEKGLWGQIASSLSHVEMNELMKTGSFVSLGATLPLLEKLEQRFSHAGLTKAEYVKAKVFMIGWAFSHPQQSRISYSKVFEQFIAQLDARMPESMRGN